MRVAILIKVAPPTSDVSGLCTFTNPSLPSPPALGAHGEERRPC